MTAGAGTGPEASRRAAGASDAEALPVEVTEILARFARRASADAPTGTIQLQGRDPVAFAGWLDLMARVEEMLAEESGGPVP